MCRSIAEGGRRCPGGVNCPDNIRLARVASNNEASADYRQRQADKREAVERREAVKAAATKPVVDLPPAPKPSTPVDPHASALIQASVVTGLDFRSDQRFAGITDQRKLDRVLRRVSAAVAGGASPEQAANDVAEAWGLAA